MDNFYLVLIGPIVAAVLAPLVFVRGWDLVTGVISS